MRRSCWAGGKSMRRNEKICKEELVSENKHGDTFVGCRSCGEDAREGTALCKCGRMLDGLSSEQTEHAKTNVKQAQRIISMFNTLTIKVQTTRGDHSRKVTEQRPADYWKANPTGSRPRRRNLLRTRAPTLRTGPSRTDGLNTTITSKDCWKTAFPFETVRRCDMIGSHIGEDQEMFHIPRHKRVSMFPGKC